MDTQSTDKKSKGSKAPAYAIIRVSRETRKRLMSDLARVNKKDFGRTVRADGLLSVALSLLQPEHLQQLQEASLSNQDRLERDYRAYVAKHGAMSKDDYLGLRLAGQNGPHREVP